MINPGQDGEGLFDMSKEEEGLEDPANEFYRPIVIESISSSFIRDSLTHDKKIILFQNLRSERFKKAPSRADIAGHSSTFIH